MTSSTIEVLSESRRVQVRKALFFPKAFLSIMLAFPLGIVTALVEAVSLFGTILPISILFALILPIAIPVIILFAGWLLAYSIVHILIRAGETVVALAKELACTSRALHMLLHAHEVAYMGLYGTFVVLSAKLEPQLDKPPCPSTRRPLRTRLFIRNFPKSSIQTFPLTPPYSDPSYTPTRSPTLTDSTDSSFSLQTPIDEPTHTSLAHLSDLLGSLRDEELNVVASYVEILTKGRLSSSPE